MSGLATRLGVEEERIDQVPVLQGPVLPNAEALFSAAFEMAPNAPGDGQVLLAAAILSLSQTTNEGRLKAGLALVAQLVARANPRMTLGPEGYAERERLLPGGWILSMSHWRRFRYSWREGLGDFLGAAHDDPIVQALDELTRLHPNEPEPISVAVKESFPEPRTAFFFSLIGIFLGIRSWIYDVKPTWNRRNR